MDQDQSTPQSDLPRDDNRTRDQQESASGGGDSPEDSAEQNAEQDTEPAAGGEPESESGGDAGGDKSEALQSAEKAKEIEEDPPENLEDWPDDKTKYETFGGAEGNESYDDSVTAKLGPSSLRHRDDGSVEIEGEEVDDPDEYKGDPIPGGPTDPDASDARVSGEQDLSDESSKGGGDDEEDGGDGEDAESDAESDSDDEDTSDDTSDDSSDDEDDS
jgi:hypothetical protein